MKKNIITISREFGSGGRFIGQQVAQLLGVEFYDREIIVRAAKKTSLSEDYIEKFGEYSPRKNIFSYAFTGRDAQGSSVADYLYAAQRQVVLDIAQKGPCVIVGRCADFILKDRADCLHVFIHGESEDKIRRIMKLYDKTEEDAQKLIADTDKKRSLNYRYNTDRKWGDITNYSMTLNSSTFGYERCARLIAQAAEEA